MTKLEEILRSIIDSATDGRDCPEWLKERIADAKLVIMEQKQKQKQKQKRKRQSIQDIQDTQDRDNNGPGR